MDEFARQIAARDRMRKALARRATPEEHLRAMARLQAATWEVLRRSPQG